MPRIDQRAWDRGQIKFNHQEASNMRSLKSRDASSEMRRDAMERLVATPVTLQRAAAVYKVVPEIGTNSRGREEGSERSEGVFARPSRRPLLLASRFTCKSAIMPEPDDGKATLDSGQLASGRVSGRETPQGSISLRHPLLLLRSLCSTTFGGWRFSRRDSN